MREEIYSEHIARRKKPKNLIASDLPLFAHELEKQINATIITVLTKVDILRDTIFDRYRLKFYTQYSHAQQVPVKQNIRKFRLFLRSYDVIDKGIWITDTSSTYYFHWLTDAIPRLIAAEALIDSHSILLPAEYRNYPFIEQSLEILRFNIKYFDPKRRLHVMKLILPGYTAPTGNYNKGLINLIRKKFKPKTEILANKKIFISREKANFRKITNEHDVAKLLESYGYEVHIFEDYELKRQIKLMQATTHLIGLHGAGLTNMLFMARNSKILELRNKNDAYNNCFFSLASDLDHDYYYLNNVGDSPDTAYVNITVNIQELRMIIEQMDL